MRFMENNSQGWSLIFSIGTINFNFINFDKEERRKKYKAMTCQERQERQERQELILKKMEAKGIEVGSGELNKKCDSEEFYQLIHIAYLFPELREEYN